MTLANVLIYVALIALVVARRFAGHPIGNLKALFAVPVVVTIIGYTDLAHGGLKPLAVTLTLIGGILSLGLGSLRGRADKLFERDGSPYVQWGVASLILFAVNIAAKLVLDVIGVAAGETFSTAGKSLIFTLGLTLVGEAIVLSLRSGTAWSGTTRPGAARSGAVGPLPRTSEAPAAWTPDRVPASALDRHHERHQEHHEHHHDHHAR
jgi:hypothetical protein